MSDRIRWQALPQRELELRDEMAKTALASMINGTLSSDRNALAQADPGAFAAIAYKVADAMMLERKK